jgi:hypothetical protein
MATTRKAAAKQPEEPAKAEEATEPQEETPAFVDEVHERGGWAVGYVGDRVDDADDDSYTVTGVLKAAQADADSGDK